MSDAVSHVYMSIVFCCYLVFMYVLQVELLLDFEELFPQTLGNMNEQRKSHKTYRIFEWIWELTSGASVVVS